MDTLLSPLPPATNDQRRRWADLIWLVIGELRRDDYWMAEQLKFIAREIEPPLKPNGDNADV